ERMFGDSAKPSRPFVRLRIAPLIDCRHQIDAEFVPGFEGEGRNEASNAISSNPITPIAAVAMRIERAVISSPAMATLFPVVDGPGAGESHGSSAAGRVG